MVSFLSTLVAHEVVVLITSDVTNDDKIIIIITYQLYIMK